MRLGSAIILWVLLAGQGALGGSTAYRFERQWPALQQPWYFVELTGVGQDDQGYLYLADRTNCRIQIFSTDGRLVSAIEPSVPCGLAFDFDAPQLPWDVDFDNDGFLYIVDQLNGVLKMTPDGVLVDKWAGLFWSSDPMALTQPRDIVVSQGFVYTIELSGRVQKFDLDGNRITFWEVDGGAGPDAARFIEANADGDIFIAETRSDTIFRYDADGNFITSWPVNAFNTTIYTMTIDPLDRIVVLDLTSEYRFFDNVGTLLTTKPAPSRLHGGLLIEEDGTYTLASAQLVLRERDSQVLSVWTSSGSAPGFFSIPINTASQMDFDSNALLFVPDSNRVQVFNQSGVYQREFLATIDLFGGGPDATCRALRAVAVAPDDSLYVVAGNCPNVVNAVMRYDNAGNYLDQWVAGAELPVGFSPTDVAGRPDGKFYISSTNQVRLYNADGSDAGLFFDGSGGQLNFVLGMDLDATGTLHLADFNGNRVVRVNSSGQFVDEISLLAMGANPTSIDVDASGRIFVGDGAFDRILVLDSAGNLLETIGSQGSFPGLFNYPAGVAVASDGRLYASDGFDRVQAFRAQPLVESTRAIIVAGGGPFPGNALWPATQLNANFAYRTLAFQGFTGNSIHYQSADTDSDLDQNGVRDDVDADLTNDNLRDAILGPFAAPVDDLLIYLVDHGGGDQFRMSGTETLAASEVDGWLDDWQAAGTNRTVTIVYDACQSGSFLNELAGPGRVIITSASGTENAYFVSQGTLSFSNFFWTEVFNGRDLEQAFITARQGLADSFLLQNPSVDTNGDGIDDPDTSGLTGRFIGAGTAIVGQSPLINSVETPVVNGSSVTFRLNGVTDDDGIQRAWVTVRAPGYNPASPDNPVGGLPEFDLNRIGSSDDFEGTYDGLVSPGTYQLSAYAFDGFGNTTSVPPVQVVVTDPLRRLAVIVAGGLDADPHFEARQINAELAVQALVQQGYGADGMTCTDHLCDDIVFLTNDPGADRDDVASVSTLQAALTGLGGGEVRDVTLYVIAERDAGLRLDGGTSLDGTVLDGWLDVIEAEIPGHVTVVIDSDDSGGFLADLDGDAGRIHIGASGAGQPGGLFDDGGISFSRFFWVQSLNGASVLQSFRTASDVFIRIGEGQVPILDDNGNEVFNDLLDGLRARVYAIGTGLLLAGDDPVTGPVTIPDPLVTAFNPIQVTGVTSTGTISRVRAVVVQPDGAVQEFDLQDQGGGVFSTQTTALCGLAGDYAVNVFAIDVDANVSQPASATASRAVDCDPESVFMDGFE